jgi:hypothetical protein
VTLNPVKANAEHFRGVLSEHVFDVPELQRPYAWGDTQVRDFIKDVEKLLIAVRGDGTGDGGDKREHLFGTVVVLSPQNLGGRAHVIDGQQRLTTVTTCLGLIENEMRRLAEQVEAAGGPQSEAIVRTLEDNANIIKQRLWRQGVDVNQPATLRLHTSREIRETYESIVRGVSLNTLPQANSRQPAFALVHAAKTMQDQLIRHPEFYEGREAVDRQRHLRWLMDVVLDQLLFILVSTPAEDAAYDLFMVLNTRGEPLNALDLLKTWILSVMSEDQRRNTVYETFSTLVDNPEKQLVFLDHYYRAVVFKSFGDGNASEIADRCRRGLFGYADGRDIVAVRNKIVEQVEQMGQWYATWGKITDDGDFREVKWPYETLSITGQQSLSSLINILGCKIATPLLLQAAMRLDAGEFEQLLGVVERVFFRYKTICSRQIGPLEQIFYGLAEKIDTNKTLDIELARDEFQSLIDRLARNESFELGLDEFVYQPGATAKRIKYFLWTLDRYAARPAPAPVVLDLDQFSVEHVSPRNPQDDIPPIAEVDSLGNLCLLSRKENPALGNKPFDQKLLQVQMWKENGQIVTAKLTRKIFDENTTWTAEDVANRLRFLKAQALTVFRASESGAS